ncbi:MAG TPA: nucleoside triphosphate pyrophosphohydrolase, partial [Thermomicrobiales bacterium]|nr:nucleoside triphosphate pyrophosphohydrolase [Thermomicrobiales bacterium]
VDDRPAGVAGGGGPVYLRTRVHPTVAALPAAAGWPSFDHLYEEAGDFAALYDAIVAALLAAARDAGGPIVYAVPGHPLVGESTVARLRDAARAGDLALRLVAGVSFVDVAAVALGRDPLGENWQLVDGLELAAVGEAEPFGGGRLPLSPLRPALIGQVYSAPVASAVKLALMRLYPDEHPVTVLRGLAAGGGSVIREIPLHELDHGAADHLTSVYVPAQPPERAVRVAQGLQAITARLRAPGGCPWDREQTHESIRSNFLEETCEALDALDAGDMDAFREELGDVLLQVYLQSQMAEEAGEFALEDVYEAISAKLVRRHPHVFGDVVAQDSGAVLRNWEQIKAAERAAKGERREAATPSALAGVPRSLPALARAALTRERAARLAGPAPDGETAAALDDALARYRAASDSSAARDALGAALFALAGLAAARGLDPEEALGGASAAFAARFAALEDALRASGRDWASLAPAERAALWVAGPPG